MTCKADKEGRISLPMDFADQLVVVDRIDDTELRLRKAAAPTSHKKNLAQLLAGITKENIHEEIDAGPTVGKEEL
jgi:hypothetical protein